MDLFCFIAAKEISSLIPALSGLDAIVFTAGIGENCPEVRHKICNYLSWLGLDLDEERNNNNDLCISKPTSPIPAYVIATNEELMIARHVKNYAPH